MTTRPRPNLKLFQSRMFSQPCVTQHRQYAAAAAAIAPAAYIEHLDKPESMLQQHAPTKPPSYKPPELRKSQLIRQYTSLLRSTPVMLVFQHNNLRANEWSAIRRELDIALRKVSAGDADPSLLEPIAAHGIKLQVIRPSIFEVAVRIVEFFDPKVQTASLEREDNNLLNPVEPLSLKDTHSLSAAAHSIASGKGSKRKQRSSLKGLLSGPIALVTFPTVSPPHLAAALRILHPTPGATSAFPAPKRREAPGYYELPVQQGLQKLLLLGAKVEGQLMDENGIKWVGAISGGIDGLRAQVIHLLQGIGGSITSALEGASRSLYLTMEGRRMDLDEKAKDGDKDEKTSDS